MKMKLNILIVDDSEDDREFYHWLLKDDKKIEWSVVETESGEDGIAKLQSENIHCVLLDYSLFGRTGLEMIEEFKAYDEHVPLVMVTGQGNESIAVECMKKGAQDYIIKDNITSEILQRAVHNAMERSSMMRKIDEQREALENFSHVLVHDLKDPISMISNFLSLIERDIGDTLEGKSKKYFNYVISASDRMGMLIDTLSEYTKLEMDNPKFKEIEFKEIVGDTISNLDTILNDGDIKITYDKLPTITGCPSQLTQLMQNLISNGIKYCENKTPLLHISAEKIDTDWVFAVSDNGIGMQDEYLERIFEPFNRLHGVGEYAGTGLGLATCKKIVERHNGRIWCESEVGSGTTFFFSIPDSTIPQL